MYVHMYLLAHTHRNSSQACGLRLLFSASGRQFVRYDYDMHIAIFINHTKRT